MQPLRLLRARVRRRDKGRQRTQKDCLIKESRHTLQVKRYRKIRVRRQKIRSAFRTTTSAGPRRAPRTAARFPNFWLPKNAGLGIVCPRFSGAPIV